MTQYNDNRPTNNKIFCQKLNRSVELIKKDILLDKLIEIERD